LLALAVLSLIIGVVLGTRYKVLSLLPAIVCGLPIASLVGLYVYGTAGLVMLTMAATLVGLQIGYLAGVAGQLFVGFHMEGRRGAEGGSRIIG
jgi:hypothetical protein